jgi:hypothetical protein
MDFSVERAEDILKHMELLEDARNPSNRPSFWVKIIHVRILYLYLYDTESCKFIYIIRSIDNIYTIWISIVADTVTQVHTDNMHPKENM